jgi:hypothetical protein
MDAKKLQQKARQSVISRAMWQDPARRKAHSEKLSGRERPDISQRMSGENNPMHGKVSPNRGKEMPQISEKTKGKKKPDGFGELISKRRKELGLGNTMGGKKRPEHSERMKSNNPGLEKTRQPWICEHCGKEGVGSSNYVRWHGDNCKHK